MEPKEIANDWAVIIDHTIQIGRIKVLLVLGLRLSNLPFNRSLNLADVQPLVLLPMQNSTGPKILDILTNLKNELGTIREIVADEGPDLKSGINLYRINNSECDYNNDIVHKLAHFLQEELKNDKAWEELSKKALEARTKILQKDYAHLIPPKRRDKARYFTLEEYIKWAYRILLGWKSGKISMKDMEAIFKEFAWIFHLEKDIEDIYQLWQVNIISRDLIRNYGIQSDTPIYLSRKFQDLSLNFRSQKFADNILQFISDKSLSAKPCERLLGSSEIIESLIGLVKYHFNSQSRSGFTSSILIGAAIPGKIDKETIFNAMTNIRTSDVKKWENTYFDSTIQKKRAKFYSQTPLLGHTFGTENSKYFTVDFEPETA